MGVYGGTLKERNPKTALLVHGKSVLGGDSIVDDSGNNVAITNNGVTPFTAKGAVSDECMYFNGSSYLEIELPIVGDCTVDFWAMLSERTTTYPSPVHYTPGGSAYRGLYIHASASATYYGASTATANSNNKTGAALALNTWYHIAIVRVGSTVNFYLNGVLQTSLTDTLTSNATLYLGHVHDAPDVTWFKGWIDELRVSTFARWAANFTPPTAEYSVENEVELLPVSGKVNKAYASLTGVASKIIKGYVGDANGKAQLFYNGETPLVVNYTGTYTDEVVQMTDGTYRLLTLTGSGTLTLSAPTECDIWLCGGGGAGFEATGTRYGGGGGGGYVDNLVQKNIQTLVIAIGSGGVEGGLGSATSISGDIEAVANGSGAFGGNTAGAAGGSGGGGGMTSSGSYGNAGTGAGAVTRPFNDASLDAFCAGGGGAAPSTYTGGAGGSNGASGGKGNSVNSGGGVGGETGGGRGGSGTAGAAESATAWGSGGGGAGYNAASGSGYQGCVMVRIKLNDEGLPPITFTINGSSYGISYPTFEAASGMTWAQWVASSYNTAGFKVDSDGSRVITADENYMIAEIDSSADVITAGGTYILTGNR